MCNVNNTSVPLLYAVLIYEDMNRPVWLRKVENIIVKLTKKELTVGIAQVKSRKPLTDIESMRKAAAILSDTHELNRYFEQRIYSSAQFQSAINKYNKSPRYHDAVAAILSNLYTYASEVFDEVEDIIAEGIIEEKKK
jgi:phosphoglycerol transferase MdoB-like AlkP superfamily enzyme